MKMLSVLMCNARRHRSEHECPVLHDLSACGFATVTTVGCPSPLSGGRTSDHRRAADATHGPPRLEMRVDALCSSTKVA
eukprot:1398369-Rhodomonas_salina.1